MFGGRDPRVKPALIRHSPLDLAGGGGEEWAPAHGSPRIGTRWRESLG